MTQNVQKMIDSLHDNLVRYRRDFHKYAESAWTEFRTSSLIARQLSDLGYEVLVGKDIIKEEDRMGVPSQQELEWHWQRALEQGGDKDFMNAMKGGFTGVVGTLNNGPGPAIGMRFDIDAVDMTESSSLEHRPVREGFTSINANAMHSCGHDGHAAMGLGVAETLVQIREQLRGTIVLIFQPAEEGVRGAKAMVGAGVVDNLDYILASHLGSGSPLGRVSCGRTSFLATQKFDAFFTGAPSHAGGNPQSGKNALLAAATAVLNLYAIPRHSGGDTRINVGRINAGTGRNVIAPNAHLAIETRGLTTELSDYMYDYALRILKTSAKMHDCTVETVAMGGALSGTSDDAFASRVARVAAQIPDFTHIEEKGGKGGGSEDFTYMMARVQEQGGQATFMRLGANLGGWGHHVAEFDFDETALTAGVKLFVLTALDIIKST